MISDDLLERGLGTLGDGYEIPPHAIDDILDQLRPAQAADPEGNEARETAPAHRHWPPSRRTWLLSSAASVLVLVIVAFAVGGGGAGNGTKERAVIFGGKNGPGSASGGSAAGTVTTTDSAAAGTPLVPQAAPAVPATPDRLAMSGTHGRTATAPSGVPADSLTKIVQTGELELQVDKIKVRDAASKLEGYARGAGGFVANSEINEGDDPSASVTLRVPNSAFPAVVGQARTLGKVQSEETKTADVTAQYVDLQARITAFKQTKATYLRILSQASTIGEILSVQQQINDTQTQIEQLQGQLKVLTDQTTYATLTVSIDQKPKVAPAAVVHHQSGFSKAVHRSVSRFVHGVEAIIGVIGPIVLVLLLLGLGWLLARVGYRIVRRQMV